MVRRQGVHKNTIDHSVASTWGQRFLHIPILHMGRDFRYMIPLSLHVPSMTNCIYSGFRDLSYWGGRIPLRL